MSCEVNVMLRLATSCQVQQRQIKSRQVKSRRVKLNRIMSFYTIFCNLFVMPHLVLVLHSTLGHGTSCPVMSHVVVSSHHVILLFYFFYSGALFGV